MRPGRVRSALTALLACAAWGCGRAACDQPGTLCLAVGMADDARSTPALATPLSLPVDVTYAPDGTLYVVDWNHHTVLHVDENGDVATVVGTGLPGAGPDGPASTYAVDRPTHVSVDPDDPDLLLVAGWQGGQIITVRGDEAARVCGTGTRTFQGDGGDCADAALHLPSSTAPDGLGGFFVSDQANHVVRQVDADAVIRTVIGTAPITNPVPPDGCAAPCVASQPGWSGDGGPALEAHIEGSAHQSAYPGSKLALGPGYLVLADTWNHVVRRYDLETGVISHVAGVGTEAGLDMDPGPASATHLNLPSDVAVGADGVIYVADTDNHCVRAITPDDVITVVAGTCGLQGRSGDGGPATEALLFAPFGLDLSPDGSRLAIADTANDAVRVVILP